VKIAPEYRHATVHVVDASRVVDVVSSLMSAEQRPTFERANRDRQQGLRAQYAGRSERALLTYEAARLNRLRLDFSTTPPDRPAFIGRRLLDTIDLTELIPFIDWTFFFAAWELKGRFPAILDHPQYGPAARELYDNARSLLDRIVRERRLTARGVYGFWPASSDGNDISLYRDDSRTREACRFHMLRQQEQVADRKPNLSLADFIAGPSAGVQDYLGAFAVTAGIGCDDLVREFERGHDDYTAILVKALADRLAEAAAAWLHARVRDEWGFGSTPSMDDVHAERHRGIRPAFGYPACPDHSEKFALFDLVGARDIAMALTEHAAMTPAASVSGLFFAHPEAHYFTVGRLGADQVADYARRQGSNVADVERWLAPNLAYDPATMPAAIA
jgi:5-methyltetrahydrofolate--homocysteine methyltransferase